MWERWQLYQPVHSTCIFWSCPPNSHTPITKAKVLPFSSPHASQACIAILVSFLQCPLQPNYFHQVTNGEVGAAADESRGPSVMCPGHKLKLGRDPATESQPRGYPLQDLNPAYTTLDKSQKHSEPQLPHLRDRKSIVSTGLKWESE